LGKPEAQPIQYSRIRLGKREIQVRRAAVRKARKKKKIMIALSAGKVLKN
jgi:hypothetical protein